MRITKSRELLKRNVSVTDTAFSVGYTDLSNFERIFKRIVGCSPVNYRKRQR